MRTKFGAALPFRRAERSQQRLRELGVGAERFAADGADHGFLNRPPCDEPALERMAAFLLEVLAGPVPARANIGYSGVAIAWSYLRVSGGGTARPEPSGCCLT